MLFLEKEVNTFAFAEHELLTYFSNCSEVRSSDLFGYIDMAYELT